MCAGGAHRTHAVHSLVGKVNSGVLLIDLSQLTVDFQTSRVLASLLLDRCCGSDRWSFFVKQVAYGFVRVAIEAMCRPIRNLTTMKVTCF